jgi:hypothetical protein
MSIIETYKGGPLDGRASTTNHCTTLSEGAPSATNAYNIVICVYRTWISLIVGQDHDLIAPRL